MNVCGFAFSLSLLRFLHTCVGSKYELASVQSGGFVKIHQVDSSQDAGTYTCIVSNRAGEESRREIELTVNSTWIYFEYRKSISWVDFNLRLFSALAFCVFLFDANRSADYRAIFISEKFARRRTSTGDMCCVVWWYAGHVQLEKRRQTDSIKFAGKSNDTKRI